MADPSRNRPLLDALRVRRTPSLIALGMAVAGGLFMLRGTPLWWIGGGLLASALVVARRTWAEPLAELGETLARPRSLGPLRFAWSSLLIDALYVSLIVVVASVMMWDIVAGERPVSHDHTVHYFKAWQLHEHFLSDGRLFGWTQRWFAGEPANYLYPIGADLWVNLVHALSFGAFGFSRSYGIAFWLFHVLTGLAGYRFARVLGGPHAGFITAILLLTDASEFRLGGWNYTINYGVWPQALSLDFALFALCHLPAIVERRTLRDLGWFGFWMGLAILTHPMQLIFLVLLLVVVALAAPFSRAVKSASGVYRLLVGYALAVAVASLWLVPFMALRSETRDMGVWWDSSYEMGKALVELRLFPGSLGIAVAAGCFALAFALKSGRFMMVMTALLSLFIPAVSNATFIDEFHLPSIAQSFTKVQFIRMSTMVKPFWFSLAACFVVALPAVARPLAARFGAGEGPSKDSTFRAAALGFLVAFLTLPIVVPAVQSFWTSHVTKTLRTVADRELLADRRQVEAWLKHNLPNDGFWRLGIFSGHNHDLMDLGAILDRPIYKRGFTPVSNFVYKPDVRDREVLEAVNLRFAVSKQYLRTDEFEQLQQFGAYRVYRFKYWRPDPFQVLQGSGDVRLEKFSDELVSLRAYPGSKGVLRLNVSYFPRWHAYRDGKELRITPTYLESDKEKTGFITVELQPGHYRFVFERTWKDWIGMPISLLGLLLCGLLVLIDRRAAGASRAHRLLDAPAELLERLSQPRFARLRRGLLGVAVLGALGAAVSLAEWRPAIALQELNGAAIARVRFDFLESLSKARVYIEYLDGPRRCRRQGDRFVCRDRDGTLDNERYVGSSPATIEEYTMVRCIRARPEEKAVLVLRYPQVPLSGALVGYYGIERAGRLLKKVRPVNFQIHVGRQRVYADHTRSDNKMHWFNVDLSAFKQRVDDVTFSIDSPNVSKRYFCFNAQLAELK
jgi:hypothetical protein